MLKCIMGSGLAVASLALTIGQAGAAGSYAVIQWEIAVAKPASEVWAKVGPYCAITDWLKLACTMSAGTGDVGSIRKLGATGATEELVIAKAPLSYTYLQTAGGMAANRYNGTLAVEPSADGKASKIHYTLVYDEEPLPAENREATKKRFTDTFQRAIETMKSLAEAK